MSGNSKINEIPKRVCSLTLTAALFTTAKRWKQRLCPSTGEVVNEIWYIHTMEYNSSLKSKAILMLRRG